MSTELSTAVYNHHRHLIKGGLVLSLALVLSLSGAATARASVVTTTGTTKAQGFGYDTTNANRAAQSFVADATGNLSTGLFNITVDTGVVSDHVTISIYSDSGGAPGSNLGTSGNIDPVGGTNNCTDITATWSSPVALTSGVTYWIVYARTGSDDNSNYYSTCGDTTSTYGSYAKENSGSWVSQSRTARASFTISAGGGGGGGGGDTGGIGTLLLNQPVYSTFMTGTAPSAGDSGLTGSFIGLKTGAVDAVRFYAGTQGSDIGWSVQDATFGSGATDATYFSEASYFGASSNVIGYSTTSITCNHYCDGTSRPQIIAGHTYNYIIFVHQHSGAVDSTNYTFSVGDGVNPFFQVISGSSTPLSDIQDPTKTRIISVIPVPNTTVGTSTSFHLQVVGYVGTGDYKTGATKVHINLTDNNQRVSPVSVYTASLTQEIVNRDFYIPITQFGNFIADATTSLTKQLGNYYMVSEVQVPDYQVFGVNIGNRAAVSTTTTFTLGTTTLADRLQADVNAEFAVLASSTAQIRAACVPSFNPFSNATSTFDIGLCIHGLLIPSGEMVDVVISNVQNGVLGQGPWGFIGSTIGILRGQYYNPVAAGNPSLPSLDIDLKDTHIPGVAGVSAISISPWASLVGPSSILGQATSPKDGKTLRQIIEPGWDIFVLMSFGFGMVLELLGLGGIAMGVHKSDDGALTSREVALTRRAQYMAKHGGGSTR